jgi:hypothetical protein
MEQDPKLGRKVFNPRELTFPMIEAWIVSSLMPQRYMEVVVFVPSALANEQEMARAIRRRGL